MGSRKTTEGTANVYAAAQKWVDCALRADDSLFTPGKKIWTRERLGEVHKRFLGNPNVPGEDFLDRLGKQLEGSPDDVYQLMGEVLYFHFLIIYVGHGGLGIAKKEAQINRVLGWSKQPVRVHDELIDALKPGIAAIGVGMVFKPNYLGFIIEFAEQWKHLPSSEQMRLLKDPWVFKDFQANLKFCGQLLRSHPNSPSTQREALLHLVFPDTFEGIVSQAHKRRIARAKPFARFVADNRRADDDRKIQLIRQGIEKEFSGDFDFYDIGVRAWWDPSHKTR